MFIAVAALGLVSWIGLYTGKVDRQSPVSRAVERVFGNGLPDAPDEWRGQVDYAELDRQLGLLARRPEMAGLAVAVVEDGKLSFIGTYGVVDRLTAAPVKPKTVFRWASVSKTVTGTLAATLASEGIFDLDRPIASWRTSLRLPGGAESQVTFAQLLSHRTGLTKNAYDERLEDGESPGQLRTELVNAPLQCVPGTCHTYQNVAFDASGEIMTKAAKRKFTDLASERFFLPLGMTSASYGMAGLTGAADWARPYNGMQARPMRESYWRVPAAAGVSSNIVDFARWMQAAMGERPDVLTKSELKIAQAPRVNTQRPYSGELAGSLSDAQYGLGWRSFDYAGHRLTGHSGAVDGYRATMIFDPVTLIGVVAMWNSNSSTPFRIPFAVFDSHDKRAGSHWLELSNDPLKSSAK